MGTFLILFEGNHKPVTSLFVFSLPLRLDLSSRNQKTNLLSSLPFSLHHSLCNLLTTSSPRNAKTLYWRFFFNRRYWIKVFG
ncbi:hypothetical protein FRX31_024304 [Thalictrum thalictroides]|uniref:Uncharacterized protein n=1 Tax=Thalictrum thalictroides TaxID=46969 RepID=A0A7J6VLY0_THATH|nr:hypothetical protein FRX31_024304 [Thalictrum thalictroides]